MRVERDDQDCLRFSWNDGTPAFKLTPDGSMVIARGDHPLDARAVILDNDELTFIGDWARDAMGRRQ